MGARKGKSGLQSLAVVGSFHWRVGKKSWRAQEALEQRLRHRKEGGGREAGAELLREGLGGLRPKEGRLRRGKWTGLGALNARRVVPGTSGLRAVTCKCTRRCAAGAPAPASWRRAQGAAGAGRPRRGHPRLQTKPSPPRPRPRPRSRSGPPPPPPRPPSPPPPRPRPRSAEPPCPGPQAPPHADPCREGGGAGGGGAHPPSGGRAAPGGSHAAGGAWGTVHG